MSLSRSVGPCARRLLKTHTRTHSRNRRPDMDRQTGTHARSAHALTLHSHTRSPSHIAHYMYMYMATCTCTCTCTRPHAHTHSHDAACEVDGPKSPNQQTSRTTHAAPPQGERCGHSIREGDGRQLELGRGRRGGRTDRQAGGGRPTPLAGWARRRGRARGATPPPPQDRRSTASARPRCVLS